MNTKLLTNEEYNGIPLDLKELINNHIAKEENKRSSVSPVEGTLGKPIYQPVEWNVNVYESIRS